MKNHILTLIFLIISTLAFAQRPQNEQLAIQYYQNGEYEKAAELFDKIYSKKQDSYIYYYYFQTLLVLNDYKELEKVVKKQQRTQPNVQRYKVDLGYVYERSGDIEKAKKTYENMLKELPANEQKVKELYNAFLALALRDYATETLLRGRKLLNNNKLFASELVAIYTQLQATDKIIDEALALVKEDEPQYLNHAQSIIQNLLADDPDQSKYVTVKAILQRLNQKDPDNKCYSTLLYDIYEIHKDYQAAFVLAKSLDKRYREDGERLYYLSRAAAKSRDYETTIAALNYVISKGEAAMHYTPARFDLLNVRYQKMTETYPADKAEAQKLEAEFKKLLDENGIHSSTAAWVRKYASLLAFYVDKPQEAIDLLNTAIANAGRDVREQALYKIDMADIQLFTNDVWEATLNYSQVEKQLPNDTIGHLAKFKNAKLSFYIGEFAWAKSQLDILRAATTKLIANDAMYFSLLISDNEDESDDEEEIEEDGAGEAALFEEEVTNLPLRYFAKADFLIFRNQNDAAMALLDTVLLLDPFGKLADDVYFQKAKLYTKRQDYFNAEKMLQKILEGYAYDILGDDALFSLAELYDYYFKDSAKAMTYYQQLLRDYSGSLFAVEARKRYRTLRGDFDNE